MILHKYQYVQSPSVSVEQSSERENYHSEVEESQDKELARNFYYLSRMGV